MIFNLSDDGMQVTPEQLIELLNSILPTVISDEEGQAITTKAFSNLSDTQLQTLKEYGEVFAEIHRLRAVSAEMEEALKDVQETAYDSLNHDENEKLFYWLESKKGDDFPTPLQIVEWVEEKRHKLDQQDELNV